MAISTATTLTLGSMAVGVILALAGATPLAQDRLTSDGHPDLQGIWANDSATSLERPDGFEGKAELTDEEFAALKTRAEELTSASDDAGFVDEVFRAVISGAEEFEPRTALIVDPPSGRIPYPAEATLADIGRGRPSS